MMRRMMIGWSFGALALLLTSKAIAEDRPVEPPGLSVREGQLVLAGRPYRGVGANYFDLFLRILHEPTNSTSLRALEQLCESGIPFVRFATAFNAHDYRVYLEDQEAYFQRLDQVVKTAERCKVGLIPSLLWNLDLPDAVGEHRDQWENPKSKTIGTMRQYVGDVVHRYKDSPAIWAWEFGNEPNLSVDLPNAIDFRRKGGTERDDLKSQHMVAAMTEFVSEVRRHDTWMPPAALRLMPPANGTIPKRPVRATIIPPPVFLCGHRPPQIRAPLPGIRSASITVAPVLVVAIILA